MDINNRFNIKSRIVYCELNKQPYIKLNLPDNWGIYKNHNKFDVRIMRNNTTNAVGRYVTVEEARINRDRYLKEQDIPTLIKLETITNG
jgi:hypothetical protein